MDLLLYRWLHRLLLLHHLHGLLRLLAQLRYVLHQLESTELVHFGLQLRMHEGSLYWAVWRFGVLELLMLTPVKAARASGLAIAIAGGVLISASAHVLPILAISLGVFSGASSIWSG